MKKKITRREFIADTTPKLLAAASLTGALGRLPALALDASVEHPNILILMVDQMQTPPEGYGPNEGVAQGLKEILGFRPLSPDNAYAGLFPGLMRLREHSVVLRRHYTVSSACVPSRTCTLTGQLPSTTGVTSTEALFKSYHDVPWLAPDGPPTIGDWFRAAGYTTHYFGKWHVSHVEEGSGYLEPWGFDEWEHSYPDPHGGSPDNLGVYRDVSFADHVVDFLTNQAKDRSRKPWLAVGSVVNPHDTSGYPVGWQMPDGSGVVPWRGLSEPTPIPGQGDVSRLGGLDTPPIQVPLNPDGFPQDSGGLPPTNGETLDRKPRCHREYALKFGLAFAASFDAALEQQQCDERSPFPFQLQGESSEEWARKYNQFYYYCHYLADLQLRRMLRALDDSGLAASTIVVFLSDHGEMAGAHGGMIQKFHNAYEETIHVPLVISSPLVNGDRWAMREIHQPTSSIDLAPTLLALAGLGEARLIDEVSRTHVVEPFVGADLSSHVRGRSNGAILGPDGAPRAGVLFVGEDEVTELGTVDPGDAKKYQYALFEDYVAAEIAAEVAAGTPEEGRLIPGPVRQPNNIRALCTGDWKLVHYIDPGGVEPDEWELYCLKTDPVERNNLVDFATGEVRDDVAVPGMPRGKLVAIHERLRRELDRQEAQHAPRPEVRR